MTKLHHSEWKCCADSAWIFFEFLVDRHLKMLGFHFSTKHPGHSQLLNGLIPIDLIKLL